MLWLQKCPVFIEFSLKNGQNSITFDGIDYRCLIMVEKIEIAMCTTCRHQNRSSLRVIHHIFSLVQKFKHFPSRVIMFIWRKRKKKKTIPFTLYFEIQHTFVNMYLFPNRVFLQVSHYWHIKLLACTVGPCNKESLVNCMAIRQSV